MMMNIDYDKCNQCYLCIKICCNSRVLTKNADNFPQYTNYHKCIYCGHCLAICPQQAITCNIEEVDSDDSYYAEAQEIKQLALKPEQVFQLLSATRSNRFFTGQAVTKGQLEQILDTMIRAPSAGNEQNRNFYIFASQSRVAELELDMQAYQRENFGFLNNPLMLKITAAAMASRHSEKIRQQNGTMPVMSKKERTKVIAEDLQNLSNLAENFFYKNAAAAILVTSNTDTGSFHKAFYKSDIAIAITYGIIMAAGMGLSGCRMGLSEIIFNSCKKLKTKYSIPANERVDGIVALGYPDLKWKQIPPRGPVKAVWV